MMKRNCILLVCVLALASVASASVVNVPSGLTGLWLFEDDPSSAIASMSAAIGTDMVNGHVDNGYGYTGPWTSIGNEGSLEMYGDNGVAQQRTWDYMTAYHGIAPNGGGSYVNEYTIMLDYTQTGGGSLNSLLQTAAGAHDNGGDLFSSAGTIGNEDAGYSTLTYDTNTWHRIVLSVDNGNFFRAYVDGELFLDGVGQAIDGRFSLNDNVHLFTSNSWGDQWGLAGTVATWDHALTTSEIAAMGGWIDGAAMPTALVTAVPEPVTMAILGLGGLLIRRKK